MLGRKQYLNLSETEVIDILINWTCSRKGKPQLNHFFNVLYAPEVDLPVYPYDGVYIAKEIAREEFGLESGKDVKPGDIDVIMIPFKGDTVFYRQTCVYEVKIARPTNKKPNIFSKTDGYDQIHGLIRDGFPYISLFYVSLSEPRKKADISTMDLCVTPANSGVSAILDDSGSLAIIPLEYDSLDWHTVDNQMRKMMSLSFPRFVGLSSFGLGMDLKGKLHLSSTSDLYRRFTDGYINFNLPEVNKMVKKIALHHQKKPSVYKKVLCF